MEYRIQRVRRRTVGAQRKAGCIQTKQQEDAAMGRWANVQTQFVTIFITLWCAVVAARNITELTDPYPPVLVRGSPPHVMLNAGRAEPVNLSCFADGATKYTWLRDGRPLILGEHQQFRRPGQVGIWVSTTGRYQCLASNSLGVAISNITYVEAAYHRLRSKTTVPIKGYVGDPVSIPCNHSDSVPKALVTWGTVTFEDGIHDDVPLEGTERGNRTMVDENGSLIISHLTMEDNDLWLVCHRNNHHATTNYFNYAHVMVSQKTGEVLPYTLQSPGQGVRRLALVGEHEVRLKCLFSDRRNRAVTWARLGPSLPIGRYVMRDKGFSHELVLRNMELEDTGMYELQLEAHTKCRFTVVVEARPTIVVFPESRNVTVGNQVSFRCEATGIPKPQILWYKNEKHIEDLELLSQHRMEVTDFGRQLNIPIATDDLTSTIHCNASNQHGYVIVGAYLNVVNWLVPLDEPEEKLTTVSPAKNDLTTVHVTRTSTAPSNVVTEALANVAMTTNVTMATPNVSQTVVAQDASHSSQSASEITYTEFSPESENVTQDSTNSSLQDIKNSIDPYPDLKFKPVDPEVYNQDNTVDKQRGNHDGIGGDSLPSQKDTLILVLVLVAVIIILVAIILVIWRRQRRLRYEVHDDPIDPPDPTQEPTLSSTSHVIVGSREECTELVDHSTPPEGEAGVDTDLIGPPPAVMMQSTV